MGLRNANRMHIDGVLLSKNVYFGFHCVALIWFGDDGWPMAWKGQMDSTFSFLYVC